MGDELRTAILAAELCALANTMERDPDVIVTPTRLREFARALRARLAVPPENPADAPDYPVPDVVMAESEPTDTSPRTCPVCGRQRCWMHYYDRPPLCPASSAPSNSALDSPDPEMVAAARAFLVELSAKLRAMGNPEDAMDADLTDEAIDCCTPAAPAPSDEDVARAYALIRWGVEMPDDPTLAFAVADVHAVNAARERAKEGR